MAIPLFPSLCFFRPRQPDLHVAVARRSELELGLVLEFGLELALEPAGPRGAISASLRGPAQAGSGTICQRRRASRRRAARAC